MYTACDKQADSKCPRKGTKLSSQTAAFGSQKLSLK